jgi:polysaccharide export outer membrane protein
MTKNFITGIVGGSGRFIDCLKTLLPGLMVLALVAGCQTQPPLPPATLQGVTNTTEIITLRAALVDAMKQTLQGGTNATEIITLREGDVLKVSFPANANLNTTQPIRRDGMISMPLIGEVKAAGKTPKQLEADLVDLYSTQLLSKEVTVEVQSSTFPVYVTGSVLRAGRIVSDHPMTAFEAIMEAGGFDYAKANLKAVVVIRQEGDHVRKFILNLKQVMDGKAGAPFYLKPGDTIYVPEKFNWF